MFDVVDQLDLSSNDYCDNLEDFFATPPCTPPAHKRKKKLRKQLLGKRLRFDEEEIKDDDNE